MTQALVPAAGGPSLELAIAAWLHAKEGRSGSGRTAHAYRVTFASYRAQLRSQGLDLDGDPRAVALVAQAWAALPRADGASVAPSTVNQRLAIVSSFYTFARRRELVTCENPVASLERRPVQRYGKAQALSAEHVAERMGVIDRATPKGQRDYALLALALQTGRRLSELAALACGDIHMTADRAHPVAVITWRHCKGGKVMHDELPAVVTDALLAWIQSAYDAPLVTIARDAPVWLSLAHNGTGGHQLTRQAIAEICLARLGTSKVHSLRHTFAHAMEDLGAKVSDIQARLGHESLETTGRYLAALRSAENAHADRLAALLGITRKAGK